MPVEAPVMRAVPCEGELLMLFSFVMGMSTRLAGSSCRLGRGLISLVRENAWSWPGDRAEPGAGRDRPGGYQPEHGKGRTEREEDVRDVGAPLQGEPTTAGRDHKPRYVCEQWPEHPPRA